MPLHITFLAEILSAQLTLEGSFLVVSPHVVVEYKQVFESDIAHIVWLTPILAYNDSVVGLVGLVAEQVEKQEIHVYWCWFSVS